VASNGGRAGGAVSLEETDFMRSKALRQSIHARERGRCFYCLRRTKARMRCLDHVVPQVEMGRNSYRNLVSCCSECNSKKGESTAGNFLRWLFREGKLTSEELKGRMKALEKLAKGGMRPEVRK
jgi:5-methylcytosine-specific restriction endonuclease McrA